MSPDREIVSFSITQDVGLGTSMYVVGSAEALGNWTPTGGVKLRWTSGNVWTGQAALPAGVTTEYKYVWRSTATNRICDNNNATWMPDVSPTQQNLLVSVPAAPAAPYAGKTVFYLTGWTNPAIVYTSGSDTNFYAAPLTRIGFGRTTNEFLYRVDGIGQPGRPIQFVMTDNQGNYDRAIFPSGVGFNGTDYLTPLDFFHLQDGQIFDYQPPATVDAPSYFVTTVFSTVAGVLPRTNRIWLPRGYAQNTWKRYPVLYMHDGQNLFTGSYVAGFSSANSWAADSAALREIHQGRMRECIIVGMDNTTQRQWEYMPTGDRYSDTTPNGIGWDYLRFVLDNVKPTLDFNFRTLPDWRNTAIMGSSLGGIISIYFGYETNVFGVVGAMSPGFGRATNYASAFAAKSRRPLRVYIDTGTNEGLVGQPPGASYWEPVLRGYDGLLVHGYAPGLDLLWNPGCGQIHTEAAWGDRLPGAFRFLFPPGDEPNRLAHLVHPPAFRSAQIAGATVTAQHDALAHQPYVLDTATAPDGPWTPVATTAPSASAWSYPSITSNVSDAAAILRVRSIADP